MMLMTILIKIRLKSKHHSFPKVFSKIKGPWTDRGHPVERTYWHVERPYWHVERTYRHVDTVTNKNAQLSEYIRLRVRPNVFNSPKELNEHGEWSMWTVGSIMLEILTYMVAYTGKIRTTILAFVLEHTGNIARTYRQNTLYRLANPGIS